MKQQPRRERGSKKKERENGKRSVHEKSRDSWGGETMEKKLGGVTWAGGGKKKYQTCSAECDIQHGGCKN